MANEFSGDDRRAIEKLRDVIQWIRNRDAKARDPKKTAALSSRKECFPEAQTRVRLALNTVLDQAENLLDANRGEIIPEITLTTGQRTAFVLAALALIGAIRGLKTKEATTVAVQAVDEDICTLRVGSTDPAAGGMTFDVEYTWGQLCVDQIKLDVMAAGVIAPADMGKFFNP